MSKYVKRQTTQFVMEEDETRLANLPFKSDSYEEYMTEVPKESLI